MTVTSGRPRLQIDPRFRERRAAVARQLGRRRLRVLAGAGAAVVLALGAFGLLHTGLFSVRHVTVRGASHVSRAAVVAAAGLSTHPPLLDVDPGRVSDRLGHLPWVRSAVVSRHWPDAIGITVHERVAIAVVPAAGRVAVVDATGKILAVERTPPPGTVVLAGAGTAAPGPPGSLLHAAAVPGLAAAGALPPALERAVRTVTVDSAGNVVLDLGGGLQATVGAVTELREKYEALASLLAGAQVAGPARIDLTIPDEPTVTPG